MKEFVHKPGPGNMEIRPLPHKPHERDNVAAKKVAAGRSRLRTPETGAQPLSAKQRAYVLGFARGIPLQQIKTDLSLTEKGYRTLTASIHQTLGSDSMLSAVLISIDRGEIVPQEILAGFDRKKYRKLNDTDRKALSKLTENHGRGFSQQKAAEDLEIPYKTYRGRLDKARGKLSAATQEQAAALVAVEYNPSNYEKHVISLIAQGYSRQEIGDMVGKTLTTINDELLKFNQRYGTKYTLESILKLIDTEVLKPTKVLEGFDRNKFQNLNAFDTRVLDAYIDGLGEDRSDLEIGNKLGLSRDYIRQRMTRIYGKLETKSKEDTVAKYFAHKKLLERKRPLDETDIAIILAKAKGQTNKQIGDQLGGQKESSIEKRLKKIYLSLDASTTTQAIVQALENEVITPPMILEDRNRTILNALERSEIEVLEAMTRPGMEGTNKELAEATHIGFHAIKDILSSIATKFGSNNRFHSAAIYAAAKKLQAQEE